MKFLAFLIIAFIAFWFFFSPKPEVEKENIFDNDEYSQKENEPQRKKLADMDMKDLNNSVNSGLDSVNNAIDSIKTSAKNAAQPVLENENVASFISGFKVRWANFKVWVCNLPVIKQYRGSIYSEENWKKEMDATDFAEYTSEQSTGARMLREGTDKFKKL